METVTKNMTRKENVYSVGYMCRILVLPVTNKKLPGTTEFKVQSSVCWQRGKIGALLSCDAHQKYAIAGSSCAPISSKLPTSSWKLNISATSNPVHYFAFLVTLWPTQCNRIQKTKLLILVYSTRVYITLLYFVTSVFTTVIHENKYLL